MCYDYQRSTKNSAPTSDETEPRSADAIRIADGNLGDLCCRQPGREGWSWLEDLGQTSWAHRRLPLLRVAADRSPGGAVEPVPVVVIRYAGLVYSIQSPLRKMTG